MLGGYFVAACILSTVALVLLLAVSTFGVTFEFVADGTKGLAGVCFGATIGCCFIGGPET